MEKKPNKNRWFLAVNGVIAILFGLLLLLFSNEIILSVIFFSGLAITLGGVCFLLVSLYQLKNDRSAGLLILQSVFSIAIGLGIMIFRDHSLHLFFILLGVWATIVGIFQLVILVNIRRNLIRPNFILFNGLLTIALGIVMILKSDEVPVFLTKLLGTIAILLGAGMIYLAFSIRKVNGMQETK